jgi:hypothetical protein
MVSFKYEDRAFGFKGSCLLMETVAQHSVYSSRVYCRFIIGYVVRTIFGFFFP